MTTKFFCYVDESGQEIDKVRGVKKEENDALVRLADALCGFIRLVLTERSEAKILFDEAIQRGRLCKLNRQ